MWVVEAAVRVLISHDGVRLDEAEGDFFAPVYVAYRNDASP